MNTNNSIGIIGAGKWGQALYHALSTNNEVYITSRTPRDISNFVSSDEILKCEYLIYVISAQHARAWCEVTKLNQNHKILIAAKGIESSSGEFLNDIFTKYTDNENLAYLSGPSFASEVMESKPTAVVVNSSNQSLANTFASFFPDFMKVYISDDIKGAEIAGSYKNVLSIASGICDGFSLGNNARASLICRGLVEMNRFGKYFGAKEETFLDLSGAGDLILSATSILSRNYRVGIELAKGKKLKDILQKLGEVAEGVYTTDAISLLSKKHNIYTPIADEVKKILDGKSVELSIKDLLK